MLIALGLEPEQMETTILPTPAVDPSAPPALPHGDAHLDLLAARPDLAARWGHMHRLLTQLPAIAGGAGELIRRRIAQLLAPDWAGPEPETDLPEPVRRAILEVTERFVIDVRGIDEAATAPLVEQVGAAVLVQLIMTMAVYDGIYRLAGATAAAA